MKKLLFIVIVFVMSNICLSQIWSKIDLGPMGNYSPMIVTDNDGYVHFGNASIYGNTFAEEPKLASYPFPSFWKGIPHFDASYFPVMRIQNNIPHIAFRTYGGGTDMGVLYWTPEFGSENWDVYFDWHGHYPSLEIDSDGIRHIWYQVDGYGNNGQETNIIYTNSNSGTTQRMVPDSLDTGTGGLYDYTTAIDNNDELHWLGAVFNAEIGPGRKLYYNRSIDGVFQNAERLPWDGAFPSMVVDQNNVVHAVWQNGDIQYSKNDGSGWTDAEIVNTPGDPMQKWVVWQQVSDDDLKSMRPLKNNDNWAWVCGDWGIFMTNNNWNNFDIQYVDGFGHRGIFPVDSLTVYCVGTDGKFWKTVNGGLVYPNGADGWAEYSTGFSQTFYDCWFHDELTGYAVGEEGKIIKTTDGGSIWTSVESGVSVILRHIDFPTLDVGYIVATSGKILKTTDGGDSWTELNSETTRNLWGVHALNADTVWVTGGSATVKVSYDGGSTWISQNDGTSYLNMGYSIFFVNEFVGYLSGTSSDINNEQKIFKTTNGGDNWEAVTPLAGQNDDAPIRGLYAIDENTAFAIGGTGKIFKGVLGTDADYYFPGIDIDQNGFAHVAYWGWTNLGWDRAIYYSNNISGNWSDQNLVGNSAYLAQIDGGSRIAMDFNTNTIYIGGLAVLNGQLFFTRDINIRAETTTEITTLITASSVLEEPENINLEQTGEDNALFVFDFIISDQGGDGLPTIVKNLNIRKGPESSTNISFVDYLGGAQLLWNSDSINAGYIDHSFMSFGDSVSVLVEIPDGSSTTFKLKTWLSEDSDVQDGNDFDFKISAAHDVHVDSSGTLMSIVPSDIISGAITFKLTPSNFTFEELPESVWFGTDYSFINDFTVVAVDDSGNIIVTVECSDLTLTALNVDGTSSANGTMTISPSTAPSFINGIVTFTSLEFSEAHQLVRIQATGTINGEVITGLSDTVRVIPYANTLVIDANGNTAVLIDVFDRLGYDFDLHTGWYSNPLPEAILEDYEKIFITTSIDTDDLDAIQHYLNCAGVGSEKALAIFSNLCGFFRKDTGPWLGSLTQYLGIDTPTIYPVLELGATENDTIYGITEDIISDGMTIDYDESVFSLDNSTLTPLTDSTNVRVVFETTMNDVGYYHDSYTYLAPNAIRHSGTYYKTFAASFFLNYFGNDSDKDTLISHLISWFDATDQESYGHTPEFSTSLTPNSDDIYNINDLNEFTYCAAFFDQDAGDILNPEVIVIPSWMEYTFYSDSILFSGTPQVSDVGDTLLVIQVEDNLGNYIMQGTRICVNHINHAPLIIEIPQDTAYTGEIYSYNVQAIDPDTINEDILKFSLDTLSFTPAEYNINSRDKYLDNTSEFPVTFPTLQLLGIQGASWISISTDGILSGIPQSSDVGVVSIRIYVEDLEGLSDSMDFSINVLRSINNAPVADDIIIETNEDTPVEIELTGTDPDDETLTFEVIDFPSNGNYEDSIYTPVDNYCGIDSFTFSVSDGELTDTGTVNITINSINDIPSDFSLLEPENGSQICITSDNIMDTLCFGWTESSDIDDDSLVYLFTTSAEMQVLVPLVQSEGSNISCVKYLAIVEAIDPADSIIGYWSMIVTDGVDSVEADNGPFSISIDISSALAIDKTDLIPNKFALYQNYPNPFNPVTNITYQIKERSFVKLTIYDINGRLVETLINEQKDAGYYTINWNASNVSSGIYFYGIKAGNFNSVKKCLVIK